MLVHKLIGQAVVQIRVGQSILHLQCAQPPSNSIYRRMHFEQNTQEPRHHEFRSINKLAL